MGQHELDGVCIKLLKLVSKIDERKRCLQECLKDGYFLLAKSRQSIGKERLSPTYYANEMKATFKVDIGSNGGELSGFKMIDHKNIEKNEVKETEEEVKKEKKKEFVEEVVRNKLDVEDPIFWFGILLPNVLHQAKQRFIDAAQVSCEICNLESELEATKKLYKKKTKVDDEKM